MGRSPWLGRIGAACLASIIVLLAVRPSDAWKRASVKVVVADAGYDSEANHQIARQDMGVRSIIPVGIGRPTSQPPSGRWRRHLSKRAKRKADRKHYSQRARSETVHGMIKRNQGSALRARTPE